MELETWSQISISVQACFFLLPSPFLPHINFLILLYDSIFVLIGNTCILAVP